MKFLTWWILIKPQDYSWICDNTIKRSSELINNCILEKEKDLPNNFQNTVLVASRRACHRWNNDEVKELISGIERDMGLETGK